MDSVQLADIITTYLNDRDDIAEAKVVEDLGGVVSGLVVTQGGQQLAFTVESEEAVSGLVVTQGGQQLAFTVESEEV